MRWGTIWWTVPRSSPWMSLQPAIPWRVALWQTHWTNTSWRKYLAAGETETELAVCRQCTHTGRPLGTQAFVHALESATERRLVPQKGGREAKPRPDARQADLHFGP
jgi:hypothetical protein